MTNSVDRLSNLHVLAFENLCSFLGAKEIVRLSTVSKGLMEKIYTHPQLIPILRLGKRERFLQLRAERAQLLSQVLELRGPSGFNGTVDQAWKKKDALYQSFVQARNSLKGSLTSWTNNDMLDHLAPHECENRLSGLDSLISSELKNVISKSNEYLAGQAVRDHYDELSVSLMSLIGWPNEPVYEKLWLGNSEVEIREGSKIADLSARLMQLMHEALKFPASDSEICQAHQCLSKFNIAINVADQPVLIEDNYQQSTPLSPPPPAVVIEEGTEDQSSSLQGMQSFEIEQRDSAASSTGSRLGPTCVLNYK